VEAERDAARAETAAAREEAAVISAQLAEARQTHDTVQAELAAERQAHAATQARLEAGRAELESAGHQLADLRTQFSTELRELGRNSALFVRNNHMGNKRVHSHG
jgi:uncharacterized protein (DUF3084 family)